MKESIQLGDRVKDGITGFSGVVTGIAEYLYGCRRLQVESEKLEGGSPKTEWFDIDRVEPQPRKERFIPKFMTGLAAATGGPNANPKRSDPK